MNLHKLLFPSKYPTKDETTQHKTLIDNLKKAQGYLDHLGMTRSVNKAEVYYETMLFEDAERNRDYTKAKLNCFRESMRNKYPVLNKLK